MTVSMKTLGRIAVANIIAIAGSASATTFDYANLFNGGAFSGTAAGALPLTANFTGGGTGYTFGGESASSSGDFESAYVFHNWTQSVGGISTTLTATAFDASGQIFVYGDSFSGGPGGLGAVQALAGSSGVSSTSNFQANPSSADNAAGSLRELVILTSNRSISLGSLTFRDGNHNFLSGSNILIDVDGSGFIYNGDDTIIGSKFTFKNASINGEFYVEAVTASNFIPLPSAAGLGMLGLAGVASRRHRK